MKKFVLMTVGFTPPTPQMMESWRQWFKSIEGKMVDQVGLRQGKEVTESGVKELPMDKNAITGYLVIQAEDMEEALEIAQACPLITSTKVYEIMAHG